MLSHCGHHECLERSMHQSNVHDVLAHNDCHHGNSSTSVESVSAAFAMGKIASTPHRNNKLIMICTQPWKMRVVNAIAIAVALALVLSLVLQSYNLLHCTWLTTVAIFNANNCT